MQQVLVIMHEITHWNLQIWTKASHSVTNCITKIRGKPPLSDTMLAPGLDFLILRAFVNITWCLFNSFGLCYNNIVLSQVSQSIYLNHSERKQQTYVPRNTKVCRIQSYDKNSLQNFSDQKSPWKVNLGWSDPFLVWQFCLSLKASYRLVSTKMKV